MRTAILSSTGRRTLLVRVSALLLLGASASGLPVQDTLSGSGAHTALAPTQGGAGGRLESSSYRVAATLSSQPVGHASSAQYDLFVGVAGTPATLSVQQPLVFGALPSVGDKGGGDKVSVFGFALSDTFGPGTVSIGGALGSGVTVVQPGELQVTVPPGTNAFGNPLGPTDIEVAHSLGTGARADAFAYAPALLQACPAHVGGQLVLRTLQSPGSVYALLLGASQPGVALPLPPVEGALEVVDGLLGLSPFLVATGDDERVVIVPNNPALAGTVVELQAVSLTQLSPLTGSFTNRLDVTIQP